MSQAPPPTVHERIEFANQLRGAAAVCVLVAHYFGVLPSLQGQFGGFPAVREPFFVDWYRVLTLGISNFNWGPFGVALFFLISGFVIPFAIEQVTGGGRALRFIVARYIRLWPVYVAGFSISAACLYSSLKYTGLPFPWSMRELFLLTTFLRDWIGLMQLDGVVWSLEVEMKFYFLSVIFAGWTRKGIPAVAILSAVLAVIADRLEVSFPQSWDPPRNFLFAARYVLFISIGTVFFHLHRGTIGSRAAATTIFASLAVFLSVASGELRLNYAIALLVFGLCYSLREKFSANRVTSFLADVSYPLYAVHGISGMLAIRWLIGAGCPAWLAAAATIPAVFATAWILHRLVELPSHRLARQVARAGSPRVREVVPEAAAG